MLVMVDEEGYLEEILLEEGEEIQFEDSQADASLQASIDKVNELQHILLLGIDARPGQTTGRSDTMIILTVDTTHRIFNTKELLIAGNFLNATIIQNVKTNNIKQAPFAERMRLR